MISSLSLINSYNKESHEFSLFCWKLKDRHKACCHTKFSQKQWNYRSTWAKYKFELFPVMYDFPITHLAHTHVDGSFRMKKVPHFHVILHTDLNRILVMSQHKFHLIQLFFDFHSYTRMANIHKKALLTPCNSKRKW